MYVCSVNVAATELFKRCKLAYVSSGLGAQCIGITSMELRAAAENGGVAMTSQLADDVQYMGDCAANYLNSKKPAAASAKTKPKATKPKD